jgi:hypothetical protein
MRVRSRLSALPVLAAAALPCSCAFADDAAESTAVLAQGRWRIEGALDAPRAAAGHPPDRPLLRLGVGGGIALKSEHGGLTLESLDAAPDAASELDFLGGARWRLRAGNAGGFAGTPWLAGADGASSAWRAAGVRPSARATAEWALPQDFSLGVTPGILVDRDDAGKRHASGLLALTLGRRWSPSWRGLVGLTGKAGGADDPPLSLDAGLAFRATDALQFDLSLSHGIAGGAPGVQAGLGLSARF